MKKVSKSSSQRSLREGEEENEGGPSFKEKCAQCLRGPKEIVRSIVLLTCTVVVIYQIITCLKKIQHPPTTTYTHFDYNDTIRYPAVTFCREPAYKDCVLKKHGLIGHPRITSEWKYFPFGNVSLDEFWDAATFHQDENLLNYGLCKIKSNVVVENTMHFMHGRCQTLLPKIDMSITDKHSGYSVLLNHSLTDIINTTGNLPPGYHVYIHQIDETFVEPTYGTLIDYLYVNVGEELHVKLAVQQVDMLVGGPKSCNDKEDYSLAECIEECRMRALKKDVNCSGPWMKHGSLPRCHNYAVMKELIINYIKNYEDGLLECPCLSRCRSSIYSTHVVDRERTTYWNPNTMSFTPKVEPDSIQTQVYIYYNNKMVSVYEEKHGYDWSLFLADFGGSLGFLLGLSVLGIITLLETLYDTMVNPLLPESSEKGSKEKKKLEESRKIPRRGGDGDSINSEEFSDKFGFEKGNNMNIYGEDKNYDKNFYI